MSKRELSNIDQFLGEEYNLWKFQVQVVLTRKDLYRIIDGTKNLHIIECNRICKEE
jgi:hypothetical protein